jgi:hypothetical protein
MTNWQWKVILALCRAVLDLHCRRFYDSSAEVRADMLLLEEALRKGEQND